MNPTNSTESPTDELWSSDSVVYLNHAGQLPLAPSVQKAVIEKVTGPTWKLDAAEDQKRVRALFASLIDAHEDDIAIAPSTAFAISLAARNIVANLPQRRAGRILLLQDQFSSAVYPWQQVCEESNGTIQLEIVPHPKPGTTWTEAVLDCLDADVIATCLPPLHWSNGTLVDLELISKKCQALGVNLVVDATQAVGIWPMSIKNIQPDLLACSVHKWLGGAPGMSLVYLSPKVRDSWIPLDFHSRSRDFAGGKAWDASKDEMGPKGYPERFYHSARKFDSGGKPNPILLPMLRASLERVTKMNLQEAQNTLQTLMEPLLDWAKNSGYEISPSPHVNHLIGIRPPGRTPEEMLAFCTELEEKGYIIAVRSGFFRISPYITTSPFEIESLIEEFNSWN